MKSKVMYAKTEERIIKMKEEVQALKTTPTLAIIVCEGYNKSSTRYINNKIRIAEKIGIQCKKFEIAWRDVNEDTLFKNLLLTINQLNISPHIHGMIVQLPIPLSEEKERIICNSISLDKDVDGFHYSNLGKLITKDDDCLVSCTPLGVLNLLNDYDVELEGKKVAVIGRSKHVGLPLVNLLINKGATVVSCNSKTKDIQKILKKQDIVISAVGRPKIWDNKCFNRKAVLIDIGINVDESNKLCGDINEAKVRGKVTAYSPVPGGVGVMTVLALMENLIKSCKKSLRQS